MQTPTLMENLQDTSANTQSRIRQLEETIFELYQSFCPIYGTIDFSRLTSEDFDTPYSIHTVQIPQTKLNVTLVTNPPHLVIGTPASHTSGPLHWQRELKIEFPMHTAFVSFEYGGEAGEVQWFGKDGTAQTVPALAVIDHPDQTRQFYFARHEGIVSMQIASAGKMYLSTLSVGVSTHD
jgi:hypothetical protein